LSITSGLRHTMCTCAGPLQDVRARVPRGGDRQQGPGAPLPEGTRLLCMHGPAAHTRSHTHPACAVQFICDSLELQGATLARWSFAGPSKDASRRCADQVPPNDPTSP
jgi:hypothetical protein